MSNNSSVSFSGDPETVTGYFEPVYDGFLIVLSVFIVAVNLLVLVAFMRSRQLRTKTNTLLASLAFSDLLMGFLCIPLYISCNATVNNTLCMSAVVMYRFIAVSTMFHIFAVTFERYISVIHPLNYITIVTGRRIIRVIIAIWTTALFIAFIQLSWHLPIGYRGLNKVKFNSAIAYHTLTAVVCFALPFLVMAWIYCKMFLAIHRQVTEIKRQHFSAGASENARRFQPLRTELRAVTIFAIMLGMFAGCWATFYIGAFQEYLNFAFDIPEVWLDIFDFLRFSTSLLNPILYIFLKHDFREALVIFLFSRNVAERPKRHTASQMNTTFTGLDTKL